MARKRKYRHITDPAVKAVLVVDSTVRKFETEHDKLAKNYDKGILDYTRDAGKQYFAQIKLAGYYAGLADPEVRNTIRGAIAKAKEKQAEVVATAIKEGKIPVIVPKEVTERAKKIAELLVPVIAS